MSSRVCWVGVVAVLTTLTAVSACPAQEGYAPGRGAIGGQIGGAWILADADYSEGAAPRFGFAATFRYVMSSSLRWQVSPGYFWNAYENDHAAPFPDLNFPTDTVKNLILDPTQLGTVKAAEALAASADSTKQALTQTFQAIQVKPVVDSATTLANRLAKTDPGKLGVTGVAQAVTDVKRNLDQIEQTRKQIEGLQKNVTNAGTTLTQGLKDVDEARQRDDHDGKDRGPEQEAEAAGDIEYPDDIDGEDIGDRQEMPHLGDALA